MEVEIFALCDSAADYSGKLCLLGTFDRIRAQKFPAQHPHCAVAVRLRFDRIEEGQHPVRISFVDDDGKSIVPSFDSGIAVQFPPHIPSVCANLILNINGMKFEKPGRYSIDLAVDSRHERSLPIHVVVVEEKVNGEG